MIRVLYSLKSVHKILKEFKSSGVCLVTSKKLKNKLGWAIKEIGVPRSRIILVPDGEKAKEWEILRGLLKKFSEFGMDRSSIVIVLGGGTVGDITGFAASIYQRGIKYIQIPTTLLAQVDSAHGGKTAINFLKHKNQIGSFHLPVSIIIESRFLRSLTIEQIIDGLGEIIKAGLIKDVSILSLLSRYNVNSLVKNKDVERLIDKSIAVKNYFTNRDFRDNKLRQILNVGHTFGHTIELKYRISHGRAVIIGMLQELKFSELLGLTRPNTMKNLENLLIKLGINFNTKIRVDFKTMLHDKKIIGDKITFPVVEREGKTKLVKLNLSLLKKLQ